MNYRHAFHAGNHTEVFKHAALTLVLEHLLHKPRAFAVLDTHAGIGVYDLTSTEPIRTNEKASGVDKVFGRSLSSAPMYSSALHALNGDKLVTYPGSPEIIRYALRSIDRLLVCELHQEDGATLWKRYHKYRQVSVHKRDGYEAVAALLPLPERRGLVFIDPPFERRDETKQIQSALRTGSKKWATGIFFVWYPIKEGAIGDEITRFAVTAGFSKVLRAEFCPYPRDGHSLAGSGIVICNPPWTLEDRLRRLCKELLPILGGDESSWCVESVS